nr:MAG TPA: hypothetical protein [Caudoviricetes sp.]
MLSVTTIGLAHTMVCEDSGMFYLNSARESLKSSLMRPRRNYTCCIMV